MNIAVPLIRRAGPEDLPELLRLGSRFHAGSEWAVLSDFSPEIFSEQLESWISSPKFVVLIGDRSFVVAGAGKMFGSNKELVQVSLLYSETGLGKQLLTRVISWARLIDAVAVLSGQNGVRRTAALDRWFRLFGFKPFGQNYLMRII